MEKVLAKYVAKIVSVYRTPGSYNSGQMFLHLATDDERIPGDMIAHTRSDALMESILDTLLHIVANQWQ